jgi:hypothetical protein
MNEPHCANNVRFADSGPMSAIAMFQELGVAGVVQCLQTLPRILTSFPIKYEFIAGSSTTT